MQSSDLLREPISYTVGVEEEFLTVDATSLELRPRGDRILAAARPRLDAAVQSELNLAQIEVATAVCTSLDDLDVEVRRLRRTLFDAALTTGSAIAATGTHPWGNWNDQTITPVDRFLGLEEEYQQLAREQVICGCHVHVAVPDPDERIQVMDRVRPWVPLLLAFAANSPFWQGSDTGYASFRTQIFDRWPTAGPPPVCGDRAGYERIVTDLIEIGMVPNESFLYWHVRPSSRYPTLELRVADVSLTHDGAVALAALFRALVRCCHRDLDRTPTPPPPHEVMRAATWRACRYGLDGRLVDLVHREVVDACVALRRLLDYVRGDCKAHGEWDTVHSLVEGVMARGNGAQRQRATLRGTGSLRSVTRMIVEETFSPLASFPPFAALEGR